MTGVYYLWDGDTVLYIGSARNVRKRIAQWRAERLDFAGYFVDEYPPDTSIVELRAREAAAIKAFKPKLNECMVLR